MEERNTLQNYSSRIVENKHNNDYSQISSQKTPYSNVKQVKGLTNLTESNIRILIKETKEI